MLQRNTKSALWVVGAAAGAAAIAWIGRKQLAELAGYRHDDNEVDHQIDAMGEDDMRSEIGILPEPRFEGRGEGRAHGHAAPLGAAALPFGASGDVGAPPSRSHAAEHEDTAESQLRDDLAPISYGSEVDASLEGIWDAMPTAPAGEQTEGYDAVLPEDLGSVWLERATETTHDARAELADPSDILALDELMVSEASRASSRAADEKLEESEELASRDMAVIDRELAMSDDDEGDEEPMVDDALDERGVDSYRHA